MGLGNTFAQNTGTTAPFIYAAVNTVARLQDPQYGNVGEQLLQALDVNDCHLVDTTWDNQGENNFVAPPEATYVPFDYETDMPDGYNPFVNLIQLHDTGNPTASALSLLHEGLHGLQWAAAPALHASPYNGYRPDLPQIVVCPTDWIRLTLLTEQNAYAKQAWLASLNPDFFREITNASPVSIEDFTRFRQESGTLEEALVRAANHSLANWHSDTGIEGVKESFGNYYALSAYKDYTNCNRFKSDTSDVIYVRIDNEDIQQIGRTIGPNIMGDPRLSPLGDMGDFVLSLLKKNIEDKKKELGIPEDETTLPSLTEALTAHGLTPRKFIAQSKQGPAIPVKTPSIVMQSQSQRSTMEAA